MILITATWCNPCKDLKKWLIENNLMHHIDQVVEADAEDCPLVAKLNIKTVPALVVGNDLYVGREQIKPYMENLDD